MRPPGPDQTSSISVPPTTTPSTDGVGEPLISSGVSPTASVSTTMADLAMAPLTVTAPWADQGAIDPKFTCSGANVSPAVSWSAAPEGTSEIAITLTDDDMPSYIHWVVAGIDTSRTSLPEGVVPDGVLQAKNGAGTVGYTGPCPPAGATHRYTLTVYYLAQQLEVDATAPGSELIDTIQTTAFDSASVTGTYALRAAVSS